MTSEPPLYLEKYISRLEHTNARARAYVIILYRRRELLYVLPYIIIIIIIIVMEFRQSE